MSKPLFDGQYKSALAGETPAAVRIYGRNGGYAGTGDGTDELWVRGLTMPGSGTMSWVFSTVHLGKEGVTVIDPGWPDPKDLNGSTFAPLDEFLRSRGRTIKDVTAVIATHAHPDHIGAAGPLAEHTGARLVIGAEEMKCIDIARGHEDSVNSSGKFAVEPGGVGAPQGLLEPMLEEVRHVRDRWYLPRTTPDILIEHGETLVDVGLPEDFPLEAVLTPGHTDGHLSFVDRTQQILIAADLIMPIIFPGIGLSIGMLGGNPLSQYLESLEAIAEFDDYLVIPGHGYCFTDLATRRHETANHVLQRAREVRNILMEEPELSIWEIASRITWSLGWEGMQRSRMLVSGLRQVIMYREMIDRGEMDRWERVFGQNR